MRIRERLAWIIATALGLFVLASIATEVAGGPLDPPGTPSSTMRTLDDVLPSWNRSLSNTGGCTSQRFQCTLRDAAVFDRETGLLWQLDNAPGPDGVTWFDALTYCRTAFIGEKGGWRAPTIEEWLTLIDTAVQPPEPPFAASVNPRYWTASTDPANAANAFYFSLVSAGVISGAKSSVAATGIGVWCVRGPGGIDGM